MIEDNRLSKVDILIQQNRFDEAEKILTVLLSEEPNNIYYLSVLAEVHLQKDNLDISNRIINNAIGLSPDTPHLFYIKARIAIEQDRYDDAEKNIEQAIALDPYDADYFGLFANIKIIRKQFDTALDLANKALEIDAENLLGLNTRSTALIKLGKSEASFETIEGALREDPNNAYTHANYGWGLLENGNHKKAMEHFKESLKNDPNFDYAQAGMLEALKASNPIYRLFLKYTFWMSNLTSKYQWGVIIGFYIGFRVLKTIAKNNESLQPYLIPLLIALAIFAFSTWIIEPISNLFLRFNAYGKLLLTKQEKMSSNFVSASIVISIIGILLYLISRDQKFVSIAVFGFAMMLPYSLMFSPSKYKHSLVIYAISLTIVGALGIGLTFMKGELFNMFNVIFLFGFVAFQWIANYFLIKEDNL